MMKNSVNELRSRHLLKKTNAGTLTQREHPANVCVTEYSTNQITAIEPVKVKQKCEAERDILIDFPRDLLYDNVRLPLANQGEQPTICFVLASARSAPLSNGS